MTSPVATILVVDDEAQNRKLLEALLRSEGYRTRHAANGEKALASIAEQAPDLILLDVMMPGMDGYQVASKLKADPATANIPIIMVTALEDTNARLAGLNAGAEDFLTKPVDRAELWLRVRNLLRLKALSDLLQDHSLLLEQQVQARTAELHLFRTAMDTTDDAITLVNRTSMRFIEVNETACNMLGHTREELLQMDPAQLYATSHEETEKLFDDIIAGQGAKVLTETRLQHKDGSCVMVEVHRHAQRSGTDWIIVGVSRDITERKQEALKLLESKRRFTDMLDNVELISMMLDRESRITYCNDYLLHLTGWQREEVIDKNWWDIFVPPEIQDLRGAFYTSLLDNQPDALHHEHDIVTRSGERRLIHWSNSVLRSEDGAVVGTASIGEDITEQKRSEASLKYFNRVLSMLSGINTLIVRVNNRDELLKEACNIAVDAGGFRMAMIVIVDPVTMLPVSITSAGKDEELLAAIKNIMSSSEGMQATLVAQAISENKAVISNNTQNDSGLLFGNTYTKAGVNSMMVIPLTISGKAVGTLALYASEIEFFQEDEMKLLSELAGDIAYAIDHIGRQEQLNYLAYYDVLTGLANRTLFLERMEQYVRSAQSGGHKLALGVIDLERFKNINDSLGRPAGDMLLKQVAEWLTHFVQDTNLLTRIDGDHFAFVVPEVKSDGNLIAMFDNITKTFQAHSFKVNNIELRLAARIGIALFPDDGTHADILFKNAEAALNKTKVGNDRFLFYKADMNDTVAGRLAMENQLRQAIDNEEFVLYYQPKVNLMSGKVTSAEALIRWRDPSTGLVPPDKFISILEETGMIYEVGRWALHKAVEDNQRWRAAGLATVRLAVNVSPLQLHNSNFIDEIKQVVALDRHAADGLELEITESVIMNDIEFNIATLQAIRAMGVSIAIDDFGTGFSSLSYLAKLPVDTLKIDRAFVLEMTACPEGLALVSTIINLAHALKHKVVAEGVETHEQSRLLRLLGCDETQGFQFSKPVPAEIFAAGFLARLTPAI